MQNNYRPRLNDKLRPAIELIQSFNEEQLNQFVKGVHSDALTDLADIPLHQVGMYWKKVQGGNSYLIKPNQSEPITIEQLEDLFLNKLENHTPNYEGFNFTPNNDEHLLVLDISDPHFGKLASGYETGDNYNLRIARDRALEGVGGILNKAQGFPLERVLFVIGNDVLHIDNPYAKTTAGTFQNTDGMFYDMFNTAFDTYVEIIEMLMSKYYVDIVFNPSNHDYMLGWTFAQKLEAWFRNIDNVTFQCDMSHRKYYKYGVNMIGTNHGDGAKLVDIPLLMAQESPQMWADTKYRYCYLHHIHHKQVTKFQSGKDFIGVTVEHLRSPSSSDSWHHRNGYTGNKKAIEGFIHHKEYGQISRLTHLF